MISILLCIGKHLYTYTVVQPQPSFHSQHGIVSKSENTSKCLKKSHSLDSDSSYSHFVPYVQGSSKEARLVGSNQAYFEARLSFAKDTKTLDTHHISQIPVRYCFLCDGFLVILARSFFVSFG